MMTEDPSRRAAEWLDRTYGGLVVLTGTEPLYEGARNLLFGCDYAEKSAEPMLACTLAVPKDGGEPFPVSNADPLDEEVNVASPDDDAPEPWRWRANARGCVVATDAAVDHNPASALPWQPMDEAPGWWDRMRAAHFPDAAVATCSTWQDAESMLLEGGPGTRAVVWLRRQLNGAELTGHLIYALHNDETVLFVDGQQGTLARLDDDEVVQLTVATFNRPLAEQSEGLVPPWEHEAPTLEAAIDKAQSWLEFTYDEPVVLVEPDVDDEAERGWLFATTTPTFQETGDWWHQVLDAALVVPKGAGAAPFLLPNTDPWDYFNGWNEGREDLPPTPEPANAAWYEPTIRELGEPLSTTDHEGWGSVLSEISDAPEGAKALVWIRRKDARDRETVGNLLIAANDDGNVRLVDSMSEPGTPFMEPNPMALHVVRFQ